MLQPLLNGVLRKAAGLHCSKPFALRRGGPLVSFTFDDVPDSACTNGAAALEGAGVRGTFYIAAGTCGHRDAEWRVIERDQVRALHSSGHEIGCHTFAHVAVDKLDAHAMAQECGRNRDLLREICMDLEVTNFAYPFGRASLPRKLQLGKRFDTCRGIYEGINAGVIDLAMLRVVELYDRTLTPEKLRGVLRETRERRGWLIFYTHDVAERPSWIGASPQLLRTTIAAVQADGIPILPVRDALTAIGYKAAGPVGVRSSLGSLAPYAGR
jgi:peptidoglycan/xylan/chitin deacetylase (PgdA/CDA1 family)